MAFTLVTVSARSARYECPQEGEASPHCSTYLLQFDFSCLGSLEVSGSRQSLRISLSLAVSAAKMSHRSLAPKGLKQLFVRHTRAPGPCPRPAPGLDIKFPMPNGFFGCVFAESLHFLLFLKSLDTAPLPQTPFCNLQYRNNISSRMVNRYTHIIDAV